MLRPGYNLSLQSLITILQSLQNFKDCTILYRIFRSCGPSGILYPQWRWRRLEDGCLRRIHLYVTTTTTTTTTTAARYFVLCNSRYMCVCHVCLMPVRAMGDSH